MSRKLLYIILGILLPWLSSCVRENAYAPDFIGGEDNPITVSFVLSTRDIMTRAESDLDWGDDYDETSGDNFENQINNVALIIYNSEGTKVTTIKEFNYFSTGGDLNDDYKCSESYIVSTEITTIIGEAGDYRFVVVANATLNEEDENETDYELGSIGTNGVPMWGSITKAVTANSNVDLGTIHLLRAVAKLEIVLSETVAADFDISRAVVTKYNSKGYVFPGLVNDESEAINYNSTLNLNHAENTFNALYDGDLLSTGLEFVVPSDDENKCYVYITEWAAIAENAKIALQFDGDNKAYEIEFKNYEYGKPVGNPHNIVRNHHYKYTITKVNTGASLELTCVVQPWTLVEESWDYTDVPAVYDDGHIAWAAGTAVNGNRVSITPSTPNAIFSFGISSPKSATWRAEFVTIKGKQNAFEFFTPENCITNADIYGSYATGSVGKKITLGIRATGQATNENNEAYLRIFVVLPDGRTIRVSDMLFSANKNDQKEYVIVQTP